MEGNNNSSLSILDSSTNLRKNDLLLNILLKDYTTGKNIKWGTNSYISHGYAFQDNQEIKINLITGWYSGFIRQRVNKNVDIQLERQRNRAEVFTPSWVIKLQVNAAIEDMAELSLIEFIQTKWLEITCGEAPYMVNRYDMGTGNVIPLKDRSGFVDIKFQRLNNKINSEEDWRKLAVEIYKASYGYEYQGDSLLIARENLILTYIDNYFYMFGAFPKEDTLLEIAKIISHNIFQMDGLTYEVPYSNGSNDGLGTQLNLFEEIVDEEIIRPELANFKLWKVGKIIHFKLLLERNDSEMKFDVVIGNPPYDLSRPGTRAKQIYPDFMESSYKIGKKVLLITPGRFLFNAGDTSKSWNAKMLSDEFLKVLYYEQDSSRIFKNTDIKGGVAITYRDNQNKFGPINKFVPYAELDSIFKKVWSENKSDSLSSIAYSAATYRLSSKLHNDYPEARGSLSKGNETQIVNNIFDKLPNIFMEIKPKDGKDYFKILGRSKLEGRVYRWILDTYVEKPDNFSNYKVFLPASNGSGDLGETLSSPLVAEPNLGHTQTFMSFGSFTSEQEATALLKYIKTKFLRTLLSIKKITQHNPISTWSDIPLQDFTANSDINWNMSIVEIDKQLYKKYDLSQEEIDFIETNVKEME